MKKFITLTIALLMMAVTTTAQNSWLSKVGLPDDFLQYENHVITGKTTYSIAEIEAITFVSGKPKYSYSYEAKQVDAMFTGCLLNFCENMINENSTPVTMVQGKEILMYKPTKSATTTAGPFAGQTYLYGWSEVSIVPTSTGCDIIHSFYPYMNADPSGLPATTPWRFIQRKTVSTINGKTTTSTSTKKIMLWRRWGRVCLRRWRRKCSFRSEKFWRFVGMVGL